MRALHCLVAAAAFLMLCPVWAAAYDIWLDEGQYKWVNADGPPILLPLDKGKAAFDRANDPAHMILTGLGPAKDQTLTVDAADRDQLFAVLGRVDRIPDNEPDYPTFGYVSSLPDDSTVLLLTLDGWPTPGNRVFVAELRSDGTGYEFAKSLHPSPAVNKDIATQSGLRLGMSREEVKAILGWPQHEDKNGLWYGASYDRAFTKAEALARGRKDVRQEPATIYQIIKITFTKGRASGILVYHRVSWE